MTALFRTTKRDPLIRFLPRPPSLLNPSPYSSSKLRSHRSNYPSLVHKITATFNMQEKPQPEPAKTSEDDARDIAARIIQRAYRQSRERRSPSPSKKNASVNAPGERKDAQDISPHRTICLELPADHALKAWKRRQKTTRYMLRIHTICFYRQGI